MAISVNAVLNLAINAQSIGPAISSIDNAFKNKKIGLQVDLQIPKDVDRQVYRVSNAFKTLDDRMRSLRYSASEALNIIAGFGHELAAVGKGIGSTISPATKAFNDVAKSVSQVNKETRVAQQGVGDLGEAIGVSAKRFASFAIAAGVIANTVFQLQRGFDSALKFDQELVKLKQVGGDTEPVLKNIADEVTDLSKGLGVSSSELIKSAVTLRQAGLSAADTKVALDALAKTTLAPTFGSIANTTEGLIAIMAQFKEGAGALEKQLGSLNRVAADFPVESEDLVEAIRRSGGAFVAAGGNLKELLALFTSVRSTTRESAESIATAFRTIFARLQRPDTIKNLKGIGIELADLEGRFVGPYEAVKRLHDGLASLPTNTQAFAKIVEDIGGIRQVSKVIPLIQQFPLAAKAYNSALQGEGSLAKDAAIAQEAFINKITKLKESFLELFRVIVADNTFRAFLDLLIQGTNAVTNLVAAFKPLIPLITIAGTIKLGSFVGGLRQSVVKGFTGSRGFSEGGIYTFADGGKVPTVANTGIRKGTDNLPALLTGGEYVFNKKAAENIGYNNLEDLHTFANAGKVELNSKIKSGGKVAKVKNSKEAAMLVMNPEASEEGRIVKIVVPKYSFNKEIIQSIPDDVSAVSSDFRVVGPSKEFVDQDIHETFRSGIKRSIANIAKKAFGVSVKVDDSVYDKVIDRSGQGKIFEAVLQSIGQAKDIPSNNQVFDFPSGVNGELARIFPSASHAIAADAKLADNRPAQINMTSKMLRDPKFGLSSRNEKMSYDQLHTQQEKAIKKYGNTVGFTPEETQSKDNREFIKRTLGFEVVRKTKKQLQIESGESAASMGGDITNAPKYMASTYNSGGNVSKPFSSYVSESNNAINNKTFSYGGIKNDISNTKNANVDGGLHTNAINNNINDGIGKNIDNSVNMSNCNVYSGDSSYSGNHRSFIRNKISYNESNTNINKDSKEKDLTKLAVGGVFSGQGVVPTVPNSGIRIGTDTVPASLNNGDFVIKKSSVDSIGINNLQNIANHATGGTINYYSKGGDVNSVLTPGEFVFKAADAKQIGYDKLNALNKTGDVSVLNQGGEHIVNNTYNNQTYASGGKIGKLFDQRSRLQELLTNIGIKINVPDFVRKLYVHPTRTKNFGEYNSLTNTIITKYGDPEAELHEFGHAIDSVAGRKNGQSALASQTNTQFKKIANSYYKVFKNYPVSVIGHPGLKEYNPKVHGAESFANAFTTYSIHKGIENEYFTKGDYPVFDTLKEQKPEIINNISNSFDQLIPKLNGVKYTNDKTSNIVIPERKKLAEYLRSATTMHFANGGSINNYAEENKSSNSTIANSVYSTGGDISSRAIHMYAVGGLVNNYSDGGLSYNVFPQKAKGYTDGGVSSDMPESYKIGGEKKNLSYKIFSNKAKGYAYGGTYSNDLSSTNYNRGGIITSYEYGDAVSAPIKNNYSETANEYTSHQTGGVISSRDINKYEFGGDVGSDLSLYSTGGTSYSTNIENSYNYADGGYTSVTDYSNKKQLSALPNFSHNTVGNYSYGGMTSGDDISSDVSASYQIGGVVNNYSKGGKKHSKTGLTYNIFSNKAKGYSYGGDVYQPSSNVTRYAYGGSYSNDLSSTNYSMGGGFVGDDNYTNVSSHQTGGSVYNNLKKYNIGGLSYNIFPHKAKGYADGGGYEAATSYAPRKKKLHALAKYSMGGDVGSDPSLYAKGGKTEPNPIDLIARLRTDNLEMKTSKPQRWSSIAAKREWYQKYRQYRDARKRFLPSVLSKIVSRDPILSKLGFSKGGYTSTNHSLFNNARAYSYGGSINTNSFDFGGGSTYNYESGGYVNNNKKDELNFIANSKVNYNNDPRTILANKIKMAGGMKKMYADRAKKDYMPAAIAIQSFADGGEEDNIKDLLKNAGITGDVSDFLDKIHYANHPYVHQGNIVAGHFDPKEKQVVAQQGNLPAIFHEIGHAFDYNKGSKPDLSKNNKEFQDIINLYKSYSKPGGLFHKQSIIGNAPLSSYKTKNHPEEVFANLFSGHVVSQGLASGDIGKKEVPKSVHELLQHKDVQGLLGKFQGVLANAGLVSPKTEIEQENNDALPFDAITSKAGYERYANEKQTAEPHVNPNVSSRPVGVPNVNPLPEAPEPNHFERNAVSKVAGTVGNAAKATAGALGYVGGAIGGKIASGAGVVGSSFKATGQAVAGAARSVRRSVFGATPDEIKTETQAVQDRINAQQQVFQNQKDQDYGVAPQATFKASPGVFVSDHGSNVDNSNEVVSGKFKAGEIEALNPEAVKPIVAPPQKKAFHYEAYDQDYKPVRGVIHANTREAAERHIAKKNFSEVRSINEKPLPSEINVPEGHAVTPPVSTREAQKGRIVEETSRNRNGDEVKENVLALDEGIRRAHLADVEKTGEKTGSKIPNSIKPISQEQENKERVDLQKKLFQERRDIQKGTSTEVSRTERNQNFRKAEEEFGIVNRSVGTKQQTDEYLKQVEEFNKKETEVKSKTTKESIDTSKKYVDSFKTGEEAITQAKVKASENMAKASKDLGKATVEFSHNMGKVVATVRDEAGNTHTFESQNRYKNPEKRIGRLTDKNDLNITAEKILKGRGGFTPVGPGGGGPPNPPPVGPGGGGFFGKIKSAGSGVLNKVKSNKGLLAGGLLALPYLSQQTLGSAEEPGAFGQTGAKVGTGLTGTIEGGALGAGIGSAFGPLGTAIGGAVGAFTGLITSLEGFSKELDKIKDQKISKAFGELNVNPKTGQVGNESSLITLNKEFGSIKNLGALFDHKELDKFRANQIHENPNLVSRNTNQTVANVDKLLQPTIDRIKPHVPELQDILKSAIEASPGKFKNTKDLEKFGPKIAGHSIVSILKAVSPTNPLTSGITKPGEGNINPLAPVEEALKTSKKLADAQSRLIGIQEKAYLSFKDISTALEVFGDALEQAGNEYQKNVATSSIGHEALAGKVSAGTAPNISILGPFAKALEDFAKPGGQLDQSKVPVSKAVEFGLRRNQVGGESADLEFGALDARKQFEKNAPASPFTSGIGKATEEVLANHFVNTAKTTDKVGEEGLRGKETEEILGRFKPLKTVRDNTQKQLESAFQTYNQQVSANSERRNQVNEKGFEYQKRQTEFQFQNKAEEERALGNPLRFNKRGQAVSSEELEAKAGIGKANFQRDLKLESLGIEPTVTEFGGQKRDVTTKDLTGRLAVAQVGLEGAKIQQQTAQNPQEFQKASSRIEALTNTIAHLKQGMDFLANSTDVLSAKQKALSIASEKAAGDLSARKEIATTAAFGSREQKQELFRRQSLVQGIISSGSPDQALASLGDEDKQAVLETLKQNKNLNYQYEDFDKYGRSKGLRNISGDQIQERLEQPYLNQLTNTSERNGIVGKNSEYANAQKEVKAEESKLNRAGGIVTQVERADVAGQRQEIGDNFTKYIKDIDDSLTKNSEVFKDFSNAANNLATALTTNPIPNEIMLTNNANIRVDLGGGNVASQLTADQVNQIMQMINQTLMRNGVVTDKTPSRAS